MNMCTELVAFTVSETFVKNGPPDALDPEFDFFLEFSVGSKKGAL